MIVGDARWEDCQHDRCDDEGETVTQVSEDERPAASCSVDEKDGAELRNQCDDAIDALVLEGVVARDTCKLVSEGAAIYG